MSETKIIFNGDYLRNLRESYDLSISRLAKILGVSRETIRSLEYNKRQPTLELAFKISHFFRCEMNNLIQVTSDGLSLLEKLDEVNKFLNGEYDVLWSSYSRNDGFKAKKVSHKFLIDLLESVYKNNDDRFSPLGLFYNIAPDGLIIAIDNSTGDAWTETFQDEKMAISWLMSKSAEVMS